MDRYGWLGLAATGWAIVVGFGTFLYARWTFARRGWTASLQTRALDRTREAQSSFEEISRVPVRTPEQAEAPVPVQVRPQRVAERRSAPVAARTPSPVRS